MEGNTEGTQPVKLSKFRLLPESGFRVDVPRFVGDKGIIGWNDKIRDT